MKQQFLVTIILICLYPFITNAQSDKTPVLILGTTHLQQVKGFEPHMIDKVIAKLDSFNFEVIGVEKMSGELLNDIRSRKDSAFDGITKGSFGAEYLTLADTTQAIKGITFLEAEKEIWRLVNKHDLTKNDRKDLLFHYLAVSDLPSAVLQYEYINNKKVFTTEFEKYIAELIEKKIATNNEYYSLAASLAKRENINQLEAIDNLEDESLLFKYYPGFYNDYRNNGSPLDTIIKLPVYKKLNHLLKEGVRTNDMSELYSFLNSDDYKELDYTAQWPVWLKTNFPSGSDKARYALWEMRNLQITANIMKLIARNPGKKTLIVIGASHSSFIEKYLEQIEVVEVLKYE